MKKCIWKASALLAVALIVSACALPAGPTTQASADLKSIRVAESDLETPVLADLTEYETYTPAGVDRVAISVETADPDATVSYGGLDSRSLAIGDGENNVSIDVTSGDGSVTKHYSLRILRCAATATMTVLDSVNGSLLPASGIAYGVYKRGFLVGYLRAKSNPQNVYLLPNVSFRIVASARDRASCALEDVVAKPEGNQYYFVCQKQGMSSFPAASPAIKSVQKTTAADPAIAADSEWTDVTANSDLDLSTVTGFRVKVDGYSVIEPTSWSGAGVMLDFDNMPGTFNGLRALSTTNTYDRHRGVFHALSIFGYAGKQLLPGAHSMNVMVYDRANNRVEKNIAVNVVSVPAVGADISACNFANLLADIRTYGVTREYFSVMGRSPSSASASQYAGGTSYRINVTFRFVDAASANQPILGFVVKRSSDGGATFVDAGSVNYGALSTGAAGTHSFFDVTPMLGPGVAYTYKVQAFTDASNKKESSAVTGTLLAAYTASLVSPAHGSKNVEFDNAAGTGPDYGFSISNPALWNPAVADYFYFAPIVREKSGTIDFYGELRYKLATNALQFKYGNGWYDVVQNFGGQLSDYIVYADGAVTCKALLFALGATNLFNGAPLAYASGVTYEWDVFGAYTPSAGSLASPVAMVSSYFSKTANGTLCRTYADVYQNGQQTINGWFEFTAK